MISIARRRRATVAAAVIFATIPLLTACGRTAPPAEKTAEPVVFSQALHDRLPAVIRTSGVIRVGGGGTSYPPLWSFGPDKRTPIGFEPDLAAALGRVLGVRFKVLGGDFATHLDHLGKHQVDVVLDSMTDTTERERQADFVNYFSAGSAIVVQRGNPQAIAVIEDLCGQLVAVERQTTNESLLRRHQQRCARRPIQIKTYYDFADALVQLRTGRVAAVLLDYPPGVFLATDPSTRANFQLASDTQYEPSLFGIAVAKDQPQLRDAIHDALNILIHSGAYADLAQRWNVSDGRIRAASINAAGGPAPGRSAR
jgi:polar amino acid transport system substrate-binding protein